MQVIAKLRNLRIAARKVRLVADLIRGKKLAEAQTVLNFVRKKAALPLLKLLKQVESNAKNNLKLDSSNNLYISKITVDEGRKLKRWRPRARGQAYEIQRKTSHITVVLDEIKETKRKRKTPVPQTVAAEEEKVEEKISKIKKPKLKPEFEVAKPKVKKEGIVRKIFRREAFK